MILRLIQWAKDKVNGKKPEVSRSQVLSARPVRNPQVEWERLNRQSDDAEDGEASEAEAKETAGGAGEVYVLMKIPRRKDKLGNVAAKVFRLPDFRKLELDEIGSDVWTLCDGEHSVEDITGELVRKYRMNRRQAEASVTAYLKLLAERRLIALRTGKAPNKATGKPARGTRKQKRA